MSVSLPEPVPGREAEFVADLFAVLGAASNAVIAEERRIKAERRNQPEARARRSACARKGWETRRSREAAEVAAERARYDDRPSPSGPVCGELYHDGIGQERDRELDPGHEGDCGE